MTEKQDVTSREARREWPGFVWPILLIGAGVFFLLSNLGLIAFNFWDAAARLWPIVLIAIGLDLLVGRRSRWASLLMALIAIALLVAGFFWLGGMQSRGGAAVTENISQPLSGAESAEVDIDFGVGELRLEALPAGSDELIAGSINRPARGQRVEQSFDVEEGVANYALAMHGSTGPFSFLGRTGEDWLWELQLNPDLPLRLVISTGVGESHLDLGQLNISSLDVETGVGETTVTLPGSGQIEANIEGGVGSLIVEIPQGVPARIDSETGLGELALEGEFLREGDVYVSPGYDDALDRIDLDLSAGVGEVVVRTYGGR